MRWFRLAFGSTSQAVSATLCAYFLGLAIGAALFGRLAGRSSQPLRLYGRVEIAAAGAALLVPLALWIYDHLYPALYDGLSGEPLTFLALKVAMALAAMLPCAILLGGSLPPLVAAGLAERGQLGREGALLYWANVSGGVLGAAGAGLFLPELVGIPVTYACGVAASAAAGAGALWLARRGPGEPVSASAPRAEARGRAPVAALAVAAVSGFSLLALEVLLVHALGRFFAHSTYSFSLVLLAVLLCMAAGAAIVARLGDRAPTEALLRWALLLEAALLLALPWTILALRGSIDSTTGWAAEVESPLARRVRRRRGGRSSVAGGRADPPAHVSPLQRRAGGRARGWTPRRQHARRDHRLARGELRAAGAPGPVGLVRLPRSGLRRVGPLARHHFTSPGGLGRRSRGARPRLRRHGAALALRLPAQHPRDGERLLASVEGADGLVSIAERDGARFVAIDEHYMFGDTTQSALYQRMGRLPLLLHPDPKRVLVIGSATGGLAAAAVEVPVEEIVLVEIISELHELAATWFGEHNRHVHRDPRARLVTEDGRNHLRGTRERYDVIVEDLFIPHQPSAAAMYTETTIATR